MIIQNNIGIFVELTLTMPAVRKNSEEQEALLKSEFPDYETARAKQRLVKFWPRMEGRYFAAFPERAALIAKGLISSKKDEDLTVEEQKILGEAIGKRKEVSALIQKVLPLPTWVLVTEKLVPTREQACRQSAREGRWD